VEEIRSENDTPQAADFRATFMTAVLSYAFDKDLRQEFKALNFPIDDQEYQSLLKQRGLE